MDMITIPMGTFCITKQEYDETLELLNMYSEKINQLQKACIKARKYYNANFYGDCISNEDLSEMFGFELPKKAERE